MGLVGFKFQNEFPNAVNNIGAASPRALENARTAPVIKAREENGKTTPIIVRHLGMPRASDASRRESGTNRSASWALMRTIGTIMKAYATDPDIAENPPVGSTTSAYANKPTTIEGTPVRTSAKNRTVRPNPWLGN